MSESNIRAGAFGSTKKSGIEAVWYQVAAFSQSSKPAAAFVFAVFLLLEIALAFLCYIEFSMTRQGLMRAGVKPDNAFYLAIGISFFMFLLWTIVLNLGRLHRRRSFTALIPVMLLMVVGSYAGGGQWVLVELASVDATREASNNLKRDVNAYLAPTAKPGELLRAIHGTLRRTRESFEIAAHDERTGRYTGIKGPGPAVQRFGNVTQIFAATELTLQQNIDNWTALNQKVADQMQNLSEDIEKGGAISANKVEDTLQEIITKLSAFPFGALRQQVNATLASAQQATTPAGTAATPPSSVPTNTGAPIVAQESNDVYRTLYGTIAAQVATANQSVQGLLDQIEQFKLGSPPPLRVESVRSVVFNNWQSYLMEIAHSIVIVAAPLLYAFGPAQAVHWQRGQLGLRRRDEDESDTVIQAA